MATDPTVFIVDDDPGACKSVALLVEPLGVMSELFSSAEDFLQRFNEARPGCLVTDVRMVGISGLELQEKLAVMGSRLPVIVVSGHADVPIAVRAVKAGAVAFLEKPCRHMELRDAIRNALAEDSEYRQERARHEELRHRFGQLSERERQILDRLIEGKAHKLIAQELDISVRTVESSRSRMLKKTKTRGLIEMARLLAELSAYDHLR